jgi:flagellar basal-body rod modification protein FlgD
MSISNIPVFDPSAPRLPQVNNGTSVEDLSQNFLRLLTVQLQNQDPLNPMDNAGMTTQLAALNQVDGINRLNNSVASLVSQMQAANFVQLSQSVGKAVQVEGSGIYFAGQPIIMGAGIDRPVTSLTAIIRDASGRVVNEFEFNGADAGILDFIWDGTDLDGQLVAGGGYRLELQAQDGQGNLVMPTPYVGATVATIGREGNTVMATLSDGRKISVDEIVKWLAL